LLILPRELTRPIIGIVDHVAIAEWWYFNRLGMSPARLALPADPIAKLKAVRQNTYAQLSKLIGDTQIVTLIDEQWSARKVLRRTLWHERDHTQHIAKLIQKL